MRIMLHEHASNYRREGSLPARQTDTQTSNSNDQSGKTEGGEGNSSCPLRGIVEHSPSLHTWEGSNVEQHR